MDNYNGKMIVNNYGICQRIYVEDNIFTDKIIITKEAFIEAYNRFIKEQKLQIIDYEAFVKDIENRQEHNECSKEYAQGARDTLEIAKLIIWELSQEEEE